MGRVWFRARPACPPLFPVPACAVGVRAGPGSRLCPALLGWVVGVGFFLAFFSFFFFAGCPCPGPCGPCPPSPFFQAGLLALFFFVVCVCMFWCPFSWWAAVPGLVLPVLAGWSPCASLGVLSSVPSGGGFGRLWWCWRAVLWLWAVFAPPPLPPLLFFFGGGAACSSLCLPWAGTHWPAFSVVFRAAVGGCVLFGRVPAPWVGWAMLWSATVVAGRAVAPCVACGAGVWRACAAPSGVCGGLLRLVPQVRVSCVVLCRSVPRRVASSCGALHCGALWCSVPWSRVVPRWVSGGQPGPCRCAECGPECGWLVPWGCG